MPLPDGFDEWEHLQDQVRLAHNQAVQTYFKNQPDDDISTPKRSLKHACLIKDSDTATMTMMRLWLFEVTCGHAASMQTPIYGIPVQEFQSQVEYKPQIKLFFLEPYDSEAYVNKIPRAQGEITFRLMHKSSENINRSDAERIANRIKQVFATPPFTWEKGWYKATYLDKERGYDLRLLVKSRAEGERVIRHVLEIQEHSFDRDYFQFVEHERSYPVNPGTHRVYGRMVRKPIKRRRVDVKFKYAQLFVWGMPHPINLVVVGSHRAKSVIERV
ncbi:hypothetical protein BZZ01_32765 (plasmid) [Nostocales cyanobacterium HT-58-2]|nr:hypothetical protein BZZ01_32765 [Nostocales cyanobacterium HT-58-2]